MMKVKVLFLASNPFEQTRLALDEEVRAITAQIRAAEHRDAFELVSGWAVRPDDLQQLLLQHTPQIVHFSGHGIRDGRDDCIPLSTLAPNRDMTKSGAGDGEQFVLVGENGQPQPVRTAALVDLFRVLRGNVRLVLFNTCHSESIAEALAGVIPCTIGMGGAVSDAGATLFAATFYRALGFGRDIQEAFDLGKNALMNLHLPEDHLPRLYCRKAAGDASTVPLLSGPDPPSNEPTGFRPDPESQISTADLPTPLSSESFFGRGEELQKLDDAWESETCRVVTIVGGWGTGKSALINEWLKRMKKAKYRGAERVFGWSFRGQGSREQGAGDDFFHQALTFFNDPNPDIGLEQEKEIRLRKWIGKRRSLLVLDGLEPFQKPPTPREEGGKITNEALRRLIRHLATQMNGLCVITSRFAVQDLKDLIGEDEAREISLRGLDRESAVRLLKKRGLRGPEEEFNKAALDYNNHPLSLSVLAGILERYYEGKVVRWREVVGSSETIAEMLDPLMANLSSAEKAVLKIVGLFDGPAVAEAVQAVRAGPPIPGLTDGLSGRGQNGWAAALNMLRELQLLEGENKLRPGDLDCHPEVRAYFAKRLQRDEPDAWREGHLRLYRHFRREENLSEENPRANDNLYLAIHHGCIAGQQAEVFDELVWEKLCEGYAFRRINGHGASAWDEMILKHFIRDPFVSEPRCDFEEFEGERMAHLFFWAAVLLYVLGRVHDAVKFAEHAQQLFGKAKNRLGTWLCGGYMSWFLAAEGNLDRALELSERCVQDMNRKLRGEPLWPLWKRIALSLHACMLSYRGEFRKALRRHKQAMAEKCDLAPAAFDAVLAILRNQYARLLLRLESYEDAEREGWELLNKAQANPVLGFLGYQVLGRIELADATEMVGPRPHRESKNASLEKAKKYLGQAKDHLNLGPTHGQTIVNALYMAQFNRLIGDLQEANDYLKRAEDAVGAFALLNMDCLLERAWLCLAQGDKATAREKWMTVRGLVNSHGYHCIDKELSDLEKALGDGRFKASRFTSPET
jgi:tetratricopeptide (TPR) repeat protein